MTDIELARALESGEIANENFHHLSHLHVAWVYLSECSNVDEAVNKMRITLRRFATCAGKAEKYHETITLFWIYLLGSVRALNVSERLEEIVRMNPRLLEKNFPLDYYSQERLLSDRARTSWVEPDLKPLPANGTAFYSSGPARDASDWVVSR